jgi:PhzF family phenazine biosynthesis protein
VGEAGAGDGCGARETKATAGALSFTEPAVILEIKPVLRTPTFQIDAFANRLFAGNPAAVMPMKGFPDELTMQAIAAENNLPITAFLVPEGGDYGLRWFTPAIEVPLCGHGSLATAAVIMERLEPGRQNVTFQTGSGPLMVKREKGRYVMDFPAIPSEAVLAPAALAKALGIAPVEVFANISNYMAVLDNPDGLRQLAPDMSAVAKLDRPGLVVTAPGDGKYDFISRYFAPAKGLPEDQVTGSAHCMLCPYWAKRMGKTAFLAFQASRRGGEVTCRLLGDRVELAGSCVFYLEGEVEI